MIYLVVLHKKSEEVVFGCTTSCKPFLWVMNFSIKVQTRVNKTKEVEEILRKYVISDIVLSSCL